MKSKIQTQDVVVMYTEQHLTMDQIGKIYGVTRQAIKKHIDKAGVKARQGERVAVNCSVCGKLYEVTRKRYHKTKRHHCSQDCYMLTKINGDYVPWRQGSRLARLIVSQYFKLDKGMVIHHKDSNQRNNKIDNLMVFKNHSEHMQYHHGVKVVPLWDGTNPTSFQV